MSIIIYHFIINMVVLFLAAHISLFFSREKNKILYLELFITGLVVSFITGYLLVFSIGYYINFVFQILIVANLGYFSLKYYRLISLKYILRFNLLTLAIIFFTTSNMFNSVDIGNRFTELEILEQKDADIYFNDVLKKETRQVPLSTAIEFANKVLSKSTKTGMTLNSALKIDEEHTTIQSVNGVDYWLLPLVYQGLVKQFRYGDIDAYVRVNATDLSIPAELITENIDKDSFSMDLSFNGSFFRNTKVNFLSNYPNAIVSQFKFVVDDKWNPYIAVYTVKPAVGLSSPVSDAVYLYDFKTKIFNKYSSKDIPEWLEVFYDLKTNMNIVNDWGEYRKGYMDSFFSSFGSKLTEYDGGSDMFFVNTLGGKAWFSGMTSITGKNQSLTHYTFINTKTGKITLIKAQGSSDENGVVSAVQSTLGADSSKWQATMPILYKLGKENKKVWILPIIDVNSKLVIRFSVVDSENLVNVSVEKTLAEALRQFSKLESFKNKDIEPLRQFSSVPTNQIIEMSGFIDAYNLVNRSNGSIVSYILIDSSNKIIECETEKNPECLVMAKGGFINFTSYDVAETKIRVIDILIGGNKR